MSNNNDQSPMVLPQHFPLQAYPSPAMDYNSEIPREQGLREYFHILLKRKWWIIGTFLSVFLMVALYTFMRTPIFRSSANLQITQDNPGSGVSADDKFAKLISVGDTEDKFLQTQYKILQSWSLAERVVRTLNLTNHPEFKSKRDLFR